MDALLGIESEFLQCLVEVRNEWNSAWVTGMFWSESFGVPGASNKLNEWGLSMRFFSILQKWRPQKNKIWHQDSLGGEDDARTLNTRIAHRKHVILTRWWKHVATCDVRCSEGTWDMRFILVMALCNQPKAFALDLGDDESHCLLISGGTYFNKKLPQMNSFY